MKSFCMQFSPGHNASSYINHLYDFHAVTKRIAASYKTSIYQLNNVLSCFLHLIWAVPLLWPIKGRQFNCSPIHSLPHSDKDDIPLSILKTQNVAQIGYIFYPSVRTLPETETSIDATSQVATISLAPYHIYKVLYLSYAPNFQSMLCFKNRRYRKCSTERRKPANCFLLNHRLYNGSFLQNDTAKASLAYVQFFLLSAFLLSLNEQPQVVFHPKKQPLS